MTVGFSLENYRFSEASVGPVSVIVEGEALQNFSVQYTSGTYIYTLTISDVSLCIKEIKIWIKQTMLGSHASFPC